ncbi:MAG: immune inhibitor A [Anaerolineae bacterium]|nr:immune inhibitor A [Anaerolineae bacterium]
MKRKILAVLGIVALLAGLLVVVTPAAADGPPTEFPRNSMAPDGPDAMDATVEMLGEEEIAIRKYAAQVGPAIATNASPIGDPATIGEELVITVSDMGLGIDYDETFVVVMDGTHGIILLEKAAYDNYDPVTDEYVFPNPSGCWRPEDRISTAQLSYLLDEFDTNIYPTDTSVFGEPLPRGDEGQKVWTLIHNIRDESYYDCSLTWYVAGYFSASEDAENNKNMMHIDSYDWDNRTGPDAARPYLYEGVFAHEFQHLIHFDQDPDEPSWVDESMADLAGFLCGYGHPAGHIAYYMVYHPMTPLTFWGGGLEDYGASYLFGLYLYEQFGGAPFISALVQEQANGIEGIENTLSAFGYSETFDEIFDNWTIANYLDDTEKAGGKYGYESLEIGTIDTWGYSIEYVMSNWWWGPPDEAPFAVPSYWFFGIEPQPYTAHYFRFNNEQEATVSIDGDDFSGTLAYSGTYEWYSDANAWAWRSFYQTFDIPRAKGKSGGATLNFYTFFEIEDDWDYGYVEVYDRNTGEWYTLDAPGLTVDYIAHAQDNPNTPDDREPTAYETAGRWHAFTGYSGGWIPVTMDLSPFGGHTIDLYFTTWQDGAFTLQMMYVDDISIPEIGFFDDVEAGEDGWIANGWYVTDGILDNGFGVTTIDTKWVPTARYPEPAGNSAMELHSISTLTVDPDTQSGTDSVSATPAESGRVKVSIVANHAYHILSSHYDFGVE